MKYNTQCFKIYFKYRLCNCFCKCFLLEIIVHNMSFYQIKCISFLLIVSAVKS